ncbi:pyrimidine 5'-nucleotidase [uncultured Shewanella sp.]|uniref:pyrimidine 5'-nucleotidase n=1 Tax=uncultured Shewanella sp. TaxID=173975 RepID=UPI00262BBAFC|nr:pyrimidine 5'-nucleotidase [uncultured Shewanella sp.]
MKYQWILFDADDTLFHFDAFKGLERLFSRYGVTFTEQDFQDYQRVNKPLWGDYQAGKITAKQLQERRFTVWADRLQVTPQTLNTGFLTAMADICALLPGAQTLINGLKDKVNLGIITNGFTQLQTIRLQKMGLLDIFSLVVISEEVGLAKPHVGIFEYAFEKIRQKGLQGTEPLDLSRILMVGDTQSSDIKGGMNVGIDTCWLNRFDEPLAEGVRPTYQINSLLELKTLLANLSDNTGSADSTQNIAS